VRARADRTDVQFPIGTLQAAEEALAAGSRKAGGRDKEVTVKARLYRTAFAASVVAVFLEGLGAGFKWG